MLINKRVWTIVGNLYNVQYTVQSQPISLLQTRITNQFIPTSSLTRKYKEWDIKVTNQIEFINIQKINKL